MFRYDSEEIGNLVTGQLNAFCWIYDREVVNAHIDVAMKRMEICLSALKNTRMFENGKFSPYHTVAWNVFLYYLSNSLANCDEQKCEREASVVYYLNKILHANDWFYGIQLPEHFFAEHPVSSVLGRAQYGDYFFVYQGTTVGGNRKNGQLYYPAIGKNVIMYANSTVLGDCHIGNNVVISANAYLINETIPDNSIVFGSSPNIVIKEKSEEEIQEMMGHIWRK